MSGDEMFGRVAVVDKVGSGEAAARGTTPPVSGGVAERAVKPPGRAWSSREAAMVKRSALTRPSAHARRRAS